MSTVEKTKRQFDYACKQASKCRHERYMISCNACPDRKTCSIQKRVNQHHTTLKAIRNY